MQNVQQVKESIKGLSVSDRSDVLLYMLRLKYQATLEDIYTTKAKQPGLPDINVEALTYDELLEQLHLLEGIRAGLQDVAQGQTVRHEEIKDKFNQWRHR